jgi:uncharacterized protein YqjF (DUF2071 family)
MKNHEKINRPRRRAQARRTAPSRSRPEPLKKTMTPPPATPHLAPPGTPFLHQRWSSLLFLHWAFSPEQRRPLVPRELEIDTYDGRAWVSLTPFRATRMRLHGFPPPPLVDGSLEVNVRTYVTAGGVPGIWFLSLDASSLTTVVGARLGFSLPYYFARMRLDEESVGGHMRSARFHPLAPAAGLEVAWTRGARLPEARGGSIEHFLVERYFFYTMRWGRLSRGRIFHRRWPLHEAEIRSLTSTMLESHGLSSSTRPDLAHAQGEPFDVAVWPLEAV